jgi:hypothetical protein
MRRDGVWRKSSRSGSEGDCVEVAGFAETAGFAKVAGFAESVGVRDSKDRLGPALRFDPVAWAGFVRATRAGRFDRA